MTSPTSEIGSPQPQPGSEAALTSAPIVQPSSGLLIVESIDDSEPDQDDDGDGRVTSFALSGKNTLTKAELAALMFERVGLNKREAKDMVEAFFDEIRTALARGETVKLSGFGNFQLREKPQRPGRNPKTGEEIPISARRVVTFHASQKLKDSVEEKLGGSVDQFTREHQARTRSRDEE
jgi:integration host factor subunit alpha